MNLITIAYKSMRQRALASSLTSLSVALGVMLMVAVLVIHGIVERIFSQQSIAYDLIVGPKGSDLQLVLSSVYRISPPIENLPYKYYLDLKADPQIEVAVPIALGDTTKAEEGSFPIVGTTNEYFENDYAPNKEFRLKGKSFKTSLDAIIGSHVARKNGWDLGAQFQLVHSGQEDHVHDEKFTVVGILAATGTPNDKTVFVTLEGFYGIADHGKPFDEAIARLEDFYGKKYSAEEIAELKSNRKKREEATREVTSVFIRMKRPDGAGKYDPVMSAFFFNQNLKKGFKAMAVNPIVPMKRLMDNVVGNIRKVLLLLTGLIIIVSGLSIFVSIYNSMADRKKEIAIMRALGAGRQTVFSLILLESMLLCFGGGLLGMLMGHGLVFVAAPIVEAESGLLIDPWTFETLELALIPTLIVLASLVGFIPGMTAYRTDVAKTLSS
ncbi:MAG: ABC transporter permease [Planctomycetes bacterium]|nr:ABC transporter permease [Planctomycetota bacterium]